MDDQEKDGQEKQSSWDSLARNLGAEAPAEPVIPKTTYVKTGETEALRKAAESAARPKAKPASWDHLAADFGLEVAPRPEPVRPVPAAVEPAPKTAESEAARVEKSSRPAARHDEDRPRRRERPERREEFAEQEDRPRRRARGVRSREDRQRERRPREERSRQDRQRHPHEAVHMEDYGDVRENADEAAPSLPTEQPPAESAPGLGVSLWHKIFGTPDQQAERITESVKSAEFDDEARSQRRGRDDETFGGKSLEDDAGEAIEVRESWHTEAVEFTVDDRGDVESRTDRDNEDEGDRRRRRRRGRGRGGRGRRREGEPSRDPDSSESSADRDDSSRESRGRGRSARSVRSRRDAARRRGEPRDTLDDDGLEEIVLDDDQDSVGESAVNGEENSAAARGRERPSGHKSIPSWDEAIGMIVETNLSTRPDRRPTSARGSGSSRGRSRGGRRRRKSS